jgi:hypothetical protein
MTIGRHIRLLAGGGLAVAALALVPASASALTVLNAKPLTAVEGDSVDEERIVAFQDDGACNEGAFTITINWGDGSSSAGEIDRADQITPADCFYDASGDHSYRTAGTYQLTATVCEGADCQTTPAATASISDAEVRGEAQPFQTVAGIAFSGNLAEINDRNRESVGGDFAATISWGDGTTSAGTVSGTNGRHEVSGSHTYAAAGIYAIVVTVVHAGRSIVLDPGSATVVAAPAGPGGGAPLAPNTGTTPDVAATPALRVLSPRIRLRTLRRRGLRLRIGVGGFRGTRLTVQLINPRNGRRIGSARVNVSRARVQGRERIATVRVRFTRRLLNRLRRNRRYGLRIANTGGLGRTLQANVTIR